MKLVIFIILSLLIGLGAESVNKAEKNKEFKIIDLVKSPGLKFDFFQKIRPTSTWTSREMREKIVVNNKILDFTVDTVLKCWVNAKIITENDNLKEIRELIRREIISQNNLKLISTVKPSCSSKITQIKSCNSLTPAVKKTR